MQNTDIQAKKEHCAYCFSVLEAVLQKKELPEFPINLPAIDVPVFVTFHVHEDELRGCIGTFSPGPIGKQLQRFTIQAAFKDTRFNPISQSELNDLDVGVSLLINFEKGKKWDQWEVGKHGIIIDFTDAKGRDYGGTFLPEVAAEQGWDKLTTIKYLIRKSGYNRSHEEVLDRIELTTYESSKDKMTYLEYKGEPKK